MLELTEVSITIVFLIEIVGTAAFALSGAMTAIRKQFDLFGVLILGVTTAVCGGLIRDIILGIIPPAMFKRPVYVITASICSLILFFGIRIRQDLLQSRHKGLYRQLLNISDAVGLGAFTVIGINTACEAGFGANGFLLAAVGAITGVGGGLLRDIMAQEAPQIFVKHIYAVASITGALVCILLRKCLPMDVAMCSGAAVVVIIRLLSAHYQWNLPKAIIDKGK
ncbi:MAG: trimeric intracellular cation channel family protein [Clostridiales bacterium]|nr:trimeric intracellular cation channel family protein [Clostridiales bacterium]